MDDTTGLRFTVEQVIALCGGVIPDHRWYRVTHFLLEEGTLQPYHCDEILPYAGISISIGSSW